MNTIADPKWLLKHKKKMTVPFQSIEFNTLHDLIDYCLKLSPDKYRKIKVYKLQQIY